MNAEGIREAQYEICIALIFFIFHSSFFIEFCEAKFLWASRFAGFACSRRAIRSITFAPLARRYGGSAAIPLALAPRRTFGAPRRAQGALFFVAFINKKVQLIVIISCTFFVLLFKMLAYR